jgi:hypothetical protein
MAATTYQFEDAGMTTARTVYYRLRQVDSHNQTAAYSPVQVVAGGSSAEIFQASVFPNPYEKTVSVRLQPFEAGSITLTVRDVLGQTLFSQTVAGSESLQDIQLSRAGALRAGVYYLTIQQAGRQQVLKLSRR